MTTQPPSFGVCPLHGLNVKAGSLLPFPKLEKILAEYLYSFPARFCTTISIGTCDSDYLTWPLCLPIKKTSNWLQHASHLSCSCISRMPRSLTVDGRLGVKPCWLKCSCLLEVPVFAVLLHLLSTAGRHRLPDALVRLFFSQLLTSCVSQCNEMRKSTLTHETATSSCALPLDSLTCCRMVWSCKPYIEL